MSDHPTTRSIFRRPLGWRLGLPLIASLGLGLALWQQPPMQTVEAQQLGLRLNRWTGHVDAVVGERAVWVLPGVHRLRDYALAPVRFEAWRGDGSDLDAPLQSADGVAVAMAVTVRYRPEPEALAGALEGLPVNLQDELVEPVVRDVLLALVREQPLAELAGAALPGLKAQATTSLSERLAARGIRLQSLEFGEVGVQVDGQRLALSDRSYQSQRFSRADSATPLQSSEGLALGVEVNVRYALDPAQLAARAHRLPADVDGGLVEPLLQGVVYPLLTRYTVREIFSTKRTELQTALAAELGPLFAQEGLQLKSVTLGNVDLPADFKAGMDRLLAAELETEQMQHTLELKKMQVRETELAAEADKVRREKAAEAAAREQVIAAKAQEEAMKHVLPFKQKQVEQRQLEAEAERTARVKTAEGMAEARKIEAQAEAESRQRLAEAEAYRLEQIGRVHSTQLERDGAVITRFPLLIQKTMADKLSDRVQVIIAAPPADGGFIGGPLLGQGATPAAPTKAPQP